MSDLVRRLRKWAERWPAEVNTANLVLEAAGRIAELEATLESVHSEMSMWLDRHDQDDADSLLISGLWDTFTTHLQKD